MSTVETVQGADGGAAERGVFTLTSACSSEAGNMRTSWMDGGPGRTGSILWGNEEV